MRVAHDSSLCGGSLLGEPRLRTRRGYPQSCALCMTAPSEEETKGDFASAEARRGTEPVWQLSDRPRRPFGPTLTSLHRTQRWKVAAALSAAVTTAKRQGTAPTLPGRTSRKKRTSLFPATLRERGSGGEALLLEKRPLPQRPSPYIFYRNEVNWKRKLSGR